MIKNERQYRITRAQLDKFAQALQSASKRGSRAPAMHPLLRKAQEDAIRSQLEDLQAEIEEYEALASGKVHLPQVQSLDQLPQALIRARIAGGLSQRELAEKLGLKEQQIQRYEATEYASASLTRVLEVARCLRVKMEPELSASGPKVSSKLFFEKMEELGFHRRFVLGRLLPSRLADRLEGGADRDEELGVLEAATFLGRIFGWTIDKIFGAESTRLDVGALASARFKTSAKSFEKRHTAYVVYAHILAINGVRAARTETVRQIPTSAAEVREAIISRHGSITFEGALRYAWDLGVFVLPLNDPAVFHGACWRIDGRNVIVLKQKTLSAARWLFDFLHELRHVAEEPENKELSLVESAVTSEERRQSPDEEEASQFAGDVILEGRAERLAELCVEEAEGKLEWLKAAVPRVAKRERVAIDSLANYLAFRLSQQGENWWGAANNLQTITVDPWKLAREEFFARVDLARVAEPERELLIRALSFEEL
jgi:transcriptional regulator with XRE-family HTH domain